MRMQNKTITRFGVALRISLRRIVSHLVWTGDRVGVYK